MLSLVIHTLKPSKVPTLQLWLRLLEVCRSVLGFPAAFRDSECEVWVWVASLGLTAIDGRVDLKTDVKVLASKEVSSTRLSAIALRWKHGMATYWSGGKTHPKVGQAPNLWKVCAVVSANSDEAAAAMVRIFEGMMSVPDVPCRSLPMVGSPSNL